MKLCFLGTGTSVGVPQIGCDCPVCTSKDPRDKRRRCGLYVQTNRVAFLIDTPPELRESCIDYHISKVDAVLLTHCHMDHVAGFDDVRRFNTLNGGTAMRCFAAAETIESMHKVFPYITNQANTQGLFRPMINFVSVEAPFAVGDVKVTPLDVPHGPKTYGYLMETAKAKVGYVSDCNALPENVLSQCAGADVMILNCLRKRPHPTHLTFEKACNYMTQIAPKRGFFIHMCHDILHADYLKELPPHLAPAYDGQVVEVEG